MAQEIPFVRELDFEYGVADQVSGGIRRVVARNPSPFTYFGTGTYIVGREQVAIIDPGPLDEKHIDALLNSVRDETITHIVVTHTHMDHSPGCRLLREICDAPTYGFGPHGSGHQDDDVVVEEGGDMEFVPDIYVTDNELIQGDDWTLRCVHTPGHTSNHMCYVFEEEKALFSGDHVMGWSTSVVSPPDGDMESYMKSLNRLLDENLDTYWPTHGPPITDPVPHVEAFIHHRQERERQILEQLSNGKHRISEMVPVMYANVDRRLHPAAAKSVFAAICYMFKRGKITVDGELAEDALFQVLED
ncbi:MAG: MBL fold metallo-hydrolase [Gammaproteobacteria bacterium]|nr:MBL fold metallo-hydrolase [Gammaproteobacteria bacterium]